MKRRSVMVIAAAATVVFALRATILGQPAQPNPDAIGALLTEVRGLRAAMEQMASAGPRIQLAIGRLQLQEQRVSTLVRRADELHTAVASVQNDMARLQMDVGRMQQAIESEGPRLNVEERAAIEQNVRHVKQQIGLKNAELQRLQAEEADAASQVTSEQARWVEINQRLEELDRALTRRP